MASPAIDEERSNDLLNRGPFVFLFRFLTADQQRDVMELDPDSDASRQVRLLLLATLLALLASLIGSLAYGIRGDMVYSLYTLATTPLYFLGLLVYRATQRPTLAAHALCSAIAFATLGSLTLGDGLVPIPIALVTLPLGASAIGRAQTGVIWSVIVVAIFFGFALFYPYSPRAQTLAWLTTMIAAGAAAGAVIFEDHRAEAIVKAEAALAAAQAEAENRKNAEHILHDSQALFSNAFKKAPSVLILADLATVRIVDVNEAFVRLSGWTEEEAVGRTLTELNIWPNTEERDKLLQVVLEDGATKNVELSLQTKSGGLLWLLASAEVLHFNGRTSLLAQGIDISDRKRLESERSRINSELKLRFAERGQLLEASLDRIKEQERLSSIGTLAAGIAHQINNPIGGIIAAAQFALLHESDPSENDEGPPGTDDAEIIRIQAEALKTAVEEARRCGRIVKNVLKFARDEPTAKWIEDLSTIVIRASHIARTTIHGQGGQLEVETGGESLRTWVSPIDIEQALVNVLHNAGESKPGGADVKIRMERRGDWARIIVSDNGEGIDPSLRDRVLDPFFTSRLEDGGTGLGLSVAHGIIHDHRGRLLIERADEVGTRVVLELPLAESTQPRRSPMASVASPPPA